MVFRIRYIEEEYRIEIEYKRDRDTKDEYLFGYDLQIIECISVIKLYFVLLIYTLLFSSEM